MKIKGTIHLIETDGRKDTWVTKKVAKDYFLAFQITHIDGQPISTIASAFNVMKDKFPSIQIDEEEVNTLFKAATLPPGVDDICHISLGNFPDFRVGRNVANDVDLQKVANAEELEGTECELTLPDNAFQVVSSNEHYTKIESNANVAFSKNVGFKRDGILNILPHEPIQKFFSDKSKEVFGKDFVLWNAAKEQVPYHITIAQTDQLGMKINQALQKNVLKEPANQTSDLGYL